jgi:hypothetical protein
MAALPLHALACAALCASPLALADEPLEPPQSRRIVAPSGRCWVYTDAVRRSTTAYVNDKGKARALWAISGWYRVAALASDCEHFVTGYDGVNLLPENFSRDTALLSFYRNGVLIRSVTLAELVKDMSKLERTVSHWSWGHYVGLEGGTRYRVVTVDRGQILFDMKTGMPME